MTDPVVFTPLLAERMALMGVLPGVPVLRIGMGPTRSAARTRGLGGGARPILVAGVAGGLTRDTRPGDVVVATEVRTGTRTYPCPSAPLLAAALRHTGLTVHLGPIASTDRLTVGAARAMLAESGAIGVDLESGALAEVAGAAPYAVVRAIVDTPAHPLVHLGTPVRGVRALRSLRRAGPAIRQWAAATGAREVLLALRRIPAESDLVLVLGPDNSSNSLRLVEVAERQGTPAYLVGDAGEVELRWLADARRIGLTAGASAPPQLVEELLHCLAGLGPVCTTEIQILDEDVRFALPER